jgi:hypothetical protein
MDVKTLLDDLAQCGLVLGLNDDKTKITVDQTNAKLTEEQKTLIREHKSEIMDILSKRDLNPKVVKGAIHWIAHRSQLYLNRLTQHERSTLMGSLSKYRQTVWELYETLLDLNQKPYTNNSQNSENYLHTLQTLTACLIEYMRAVKESVSCVMKENQTPTP